MTRKKHFAIISLRSNDNLKASKTEQEMFTLKEIKRFFGLHFDFHAGNENEIGSHTEPTDIEWFIAQAHPDYIQCDCKGHPGNASYPTKVGHPAEKLVKDNLRIWCDTVKKHGLPLFVHYSGVFDIHYAQTHPEDAACDENGKPTAKISVFGPYVHKLLIPQLKELIDNYGIDGAWIDGECWAVERDFSENVKPYLRDGLTVQEHTALMREGYLRYVKTYVDEIHAYAPNFKIASNWLYSGVVPGKPEIDVDFLSGDFAANNSVSVYAERFQSRCMAAQNRPWDLMAWSFSPGHHADKSAVQLMQEAAPVLMQGGGFQLYFIQNPDGSAKRIQSDTLRKTAEFVHARRMLFEKKPIAQVGIFYSETAYMQLPPTEVCAMFGNQDALKAVVGTLNVTLDAQYTAGIIYEYQTDTLKNYDIVIVPEWATLDGAIEEKLTAYAEEGGNLLVIGAKACKKFGTRYDTNFREMNEHKLLYITDENGSFCPITDASDTCEALDIGNGVSALYSFSDLRTALAPAYRIDTIGKGKIGWLPIDFGSAYYRFQSHIHINFFKKLLTDFVKPFVEADRKSIEISLQKAENGLILNLLNTVEGHNAASCLTFDELAPIYDITLRVRKAFSKASMPLGEEFSFETGADETVIRLKRLDVHSIIVLENTK